MRLSVYSNAPWAPTGYGTQTAQLVRRLAADGHDVAVLANHGLMGTVLDWHGIPVYPGGATQYSLDVAESQHRSHLGGIRGAVLTLYDVWPLGNTWADQPVISWVPVDHSPVSPEIVAWCSKPNVRVVAMSRFGQRELAQAGVSATYIPHALDEFRPMPSDVRRALNVPDDAFLVVINAANQGLAPARKAWWEMLAGFTAFARDHTDAYIYLHADLNRPNGVNIPYWAAMCGLPPDRLRAVDQAMYRSGGVSTERMAQIYTAADVLLATSMGEGFGLPVIEAQACGTPVIVTDFSAQPELVGAGWKVKYQPTPYYAMGGFLATPSIPGIRDALEQAYAARGSADLAAQALAKAAEYDADTVYAESWRPLLKEVAEGLAPVRKHMSRGAKKRARKVAA